MQELEARQEVVAKGSRMEALDCAADEILKAARKLEKEVRRETKYWQELVSVSEKGWPIQRLRQNARHVPFGVRFGLPEGTPCPNYPQNILLTYQAGEQFKARGFAPLQMDKHGSIILDPALTVKPKTFRVRVKVDGKVTGTSQLSLAGDVKNKSIEASIQLARDSLFEEELYHEMSLETRQLSAYGVEFRDAVIQVDAPRMGSVEQHRQLLIDCIPRDEPSPSDQDHSHDWLAQNVAEALRLLLAHEHSMRLYRRSQLPPPLTARNRDKQPPPLLRTLLAVLRHLESVDSLYVYLESLAGTLTSAGLDVRLDTTRESSWAKLAEGLRAPRAGYSVVDQLLEVFTRPFDGKATLTLPILNGAQSESLIISTRTIIGQPTFGTEHKLTLPRSLTSGLGLPLQLKFSAVDELKSYLDWVLSLYVVHKVVKGAFHSRGPPEGNEPKISIAIKKGGKEGPVVSKHIAVTCREGLLEAVASPAYSPPADEGDVEQKHNWDGSQGGPSLIDWIKGLAG